MSQRDSRQLQSDLGEGIKDVAESTKADLDALQRIVEANVDSTAAIQHEVGQQTLTLTAIQSEDSNSISSITPEIHHLQLEQNSMIENFLRPALAEHETTSREILNAVQASGQRLSVIEMTISQTAERMDQTDVLSGSNSAVSNPTFAQIIRGDENGTLDQPHWKFSL